MAVSAGLIFLVIYKEKQWVWKQTPWESMECGESRMRAFLPLFTWYQPFHLHDWGEGAQPSETLGVPMLLPFVFQGRAASLLPVGADCLQSPQNAKCRAPPRVVHT